MTVLTFGRIADVCGAAALDMPAAADTGALVTQLHERFPALRGLSFVLAVDQKTVAGNTPLYPTSVVAVLPPFSGG